LGWKALLAEKPSVLRNGAVVEDPAFPNRSRAYFFQPDHGEPSKNAWTNQLLMIEGDGQDADMLE
jgi:hypothetical protein